MVRFFVGVASRAHVKIGEHGGFCQLCHGKAWAVNRLSPGDWIVYYSPREDMRSGDVVQGFTAIGNIKVGASYEVDVTPGFKPTRRDVTFFKAKEAPIRPLLPHLSFIGDAPSWGMIFQRGLIEIPRPDFELIAAAMEVAI